MFWNGRKSLMLFAALFLVAFLPVPILSSSNCGSCESSASCSSSSSSEEEPADCGKFKFTNLHSQVYFLLFLGECRPPTTLTYCKKPVGIVLNGEVGNEISTFHSFAGNFTIRNNLMHKT